jgi:hypothetical protein
MTKKQKDIIRKLHVLMVGCTLPNGCKTYEKGVEHE